MKNKFVAIGLGVLVLVVGAILLLQGCHKSKKEANRDLIRVEEAPKSATSSVKPQELYQQAVALEKNNEILEARDRYKEVMTNYPDYEGMETVQKGLEGLNMKMILTPMPSPKAVIHEVKAGDTLGKLAKTYGTTVELIKRRNNINNDVIRLGQKLSIWTGSFNIFVDKSQNILILKDGEEVIKVYDVSTGANNITPVGTFKIASKLINPVWFKAGAVIPPESPQNVLGTRWMGFDLPGYGIHGTIEPEKMRQQVTAGCVRMRNEEVEELYDLIPIGTTVTIVD